MVPARAPGKNAAARVSSLRIRSGSTDHARGDAITPVGRDEAACRRWRGCRLQPLASPADACRQPPTGLPQHRVHSAARRLVRVACGPVFPRARAARRLARCTGSPAPAGRGGRLARRHGWGERAGLPPVRQRHRGHRHRGPARPGAGVPRLVRGHPGRAGRVPRLHGHPGSGAAIRGPAGLDHARPLLEAGAARRLARLVPALRPASPGRGAGILEEPSHAVLVRRLVPTRAGGTKCPCPGGSRRRSCCWYCSRR